MKAWELLDTGIHSAVENMAIDTQLLESLNQRQSPLLHIYEWSRPSITYGYFADPAKWMHMLAAEELGIDIAKRPTGGGITLHIGDLAFSAFMPATDPRFTCCTLENYAYINRAVVDAIKKCSPLDSLDLLADAPQPGIEAQRHFCMAHPTKYDVVIGGKKVGGAAQRRTKFGYLHHGTICIKAPDELLLRSILKDYEALGPAILQTSYSLNIDPKKLMHCLLQSLNQNTRENIS